MSFEFSIPYLPSADIPPSGRNPELVTIDGFSHRRFENRRGMATHARDRIHSQDDGADGPPKFHVERERFREHSSTPLPDRQELGADGRN